MAIKPGHGKSPINSSMMFPAIFNLQTSFRDFTDVLSICASKKPPGRRTTFPDHLWESCVSWAHRKWKQWRDPRCSPTLRCSTQRPRCCKLFSPGEKPKKSWSGEKSPQNFIQIWCVSTQNHWHFMNILNQFEPQLSPCSPHLPMFWSRPSADLPHWTQRCFPVGSPFQSAGTRHSAHWRSWKQHPPPSSAAMVVGQIQQVHEKPS